MQWLVKWAIIAGLVFLVITALNISNQAVNDLTSQKGGKLLSVGMQEGNLNMDIFGNSYVVNMDKLKEKNYMEHKIENTTEQIAAHFTKSWRIFKVLFL